MPLDIDPKLVVMAALAVPVLYIFFEWEFSVLFLAALAGLGWYYFDGNFVNKADVTKRSVPQLGPQQPFLPSEKQWGVAPDGTPIPPSYQPPPQQYPPQP